jgi:60 kDa SS-A/Ro ribonucleoprotein
MSKFSNSASVARKAPRTASVKTVNLAGGTGYTQSPKLELASLLLTSFLQDEHYRSAASTQLRLKELVAAVDPLFAAKAAVFARDEFGMRSVSHVVASEIGKLVKGADWSRAFFEKVVIRPDDVVEILACYLGTHGKPIPNAMKRGLGARLTRFDEYRLAKYRGAGNTFKLVDAVNLLRPKASKALTALMKGTLAPAETWETKLTQAGQQVDVDKTEAKAAAWKQLLEDEKLGTLAALRNVRNIADQADAASVLKLIEVLTNPDHIRKARIFPFQILSAYEAVESSTIEVARKRQLLGALSDALDISVSNIPSFEGDSAVLLDTSGSMTTGSETCKSPAKIGSIFAAALAKAWNADVMSWSDRAQFVTFNPRDSVMSIAKGIPFHNGGTNLSQAFNALGKRYSRVIVLSDMQTWVDGSTGAQPAWKAYQTRMGCQPHLYSFDLKSYGTMAIPESRVYCLAGYSDKVFEIMGKLERDRDALVNAIEAVVFTKPAKAEKGN